MIPEIVVLKERLTPLISENETFRSSYDLLVSIEDLEETKVELGETEELRNVSLQKLKEELKKDKTTLYRMDDAYLLRFLRYKKFDCDKSYKHIRKFYNFRKERSDIFTVPSNLEFLLNLKLCKMFPYRDEEGSVTYWADFRYWDPEKICPKIFCQILTANCDVITVDPTAQISGVIIFIDMRGFSSFIAQAIYPRVLALFSRLLQDCYPVRIKKVIIINVNSAVRAFYATVRSFMKKKIRDRIVFLGQDLTDLKHHINPVFLPKEYGGTIEEDDCIYTEYIMKNMPYIEYERSFQ